MRLSNIITANWDFWTKLNFDPAYRDIVDEYCAKSNPLWVYKHIRSKFGKYMCGFHSHTDGYSLSDIAEKAATVGYKLFAVTNHDDKKHEGDAQFEGKRILHFNFPDIGDKGRDIFLWRGIEYNCIDGDDIVKLLILGYRNKIPKEMNVDRAVMAAIGENSLLISTSTLNKGSRERGLNEQEVRAHLPELDAIGILDSGFGMGGLKLTRFYQSDIRACRLAEDLGKAGVYEPNCHILDEIGVSGTHIEKEHLSCLALPPEELEKNPDMLNEQMRTVFRKQAFENDGGYLPALSFLNYRRAKVIIVDTAHAQKRNVRDLIKKLDD